MQVAHHAPQLLAREAVERAEGLIQHEKLRLVNQGPAQRGALLHAARQLPGKLGAHAGKADLRQQRLDLGDVGGPLGAQASAVGLHDFQRQQDVLERGAPGQQVGRLERHAGDLQRADDFLAANFYVAGLRKLQPGDELHQGRLAAAGGADHGGKLAFPDRQRELVHGRHALSAVGVRHVVNLDEGGHGASGKCCASPCIEGWPSCRRRASHDAKRGEGDASAV